MTWSFVGVVGTADRLVSARVAEIARAMDAHGEAPALILQPKQNPVLGIAISRKAVSPPDVYRAANRSLVLVDGEVFNRRELAELIGSSESQFADRPAALLSACIAKLGIDVLKRVDAAASILHWNAYRGELTIARDRLGHSQTFFADHEGFTYFSNDLTALITLGVDRRLDFAALDSFLARGRIPAPWTLFEAIRKIPASHVLTVRKGRAPFVTRYAVPTMRSPVLPMPDLKQQIAETDSLFIQAIERRFSRSRTGGVLLTGGFASALLLATLAEKFGAPREAVSFDYGNSTEGIERARAVAARYGARHSVLSCSPREFAAQLQAITLAHGEPVSARLTSILVPEIRRSGLELLFVAQGLGSLELSRAERAAIRLNQMPRPVRAAGQATHRLLAGLHLSQSTETMANIWSAKNGLPSLLAPSLMTDSERRQLYAAVDGGADYSQRTIELLRQMALDFGGYSPADEGRLLHSHGFEAESFGKTASWSRAGGVLVRSPYADADLQTYIVDATPDGNGAELVKAYAATVLPSEFAAKPEPGGVLPVGRWLKGPFRELLHHHVKALKAVGFFRPQRLDAMVDLHLKGRRDYGNQLWALVAFSIWQDAVLDAAKEIPEFSAAPVLAGAE